MPSPELTLDPSRISVLLCYLLRLAPPSYPTRSYAVRPPEMATPALLSFYVPCLSLEPSVLTAPELMLYSLLRLRWTPSVYPP